MTDITSLQAFFKQNDKKTSRLLALVIVFGLGWYLGRIMSPYYNTTPIIFQDRQCSACSSSGGTAQELQALKSEGEGESAAQVAGTTSQTQGEFVSSINSNLYHHASCPSASRIKPENQQWFATAEEARAAGLTPSKCTHDLGY